jgi:hypothetical protein
MSILFLSLGLLTLLFVMSAVRITIRGPSGGPSVDWGVAIAEGVFIVLAWVWAMGYRSNLP